MSEAAGYAGTTQAGGEATVDDLIALLDKAYEDFYDCGFCDHHSKSSEGAISLGFGRFGDRRDQPSVTVYSYVFGPSRSHDFASLDEAIATVRSWVDGIEHGPKCDGWGDFDEEPADSATEEDA